MDSTQLIKGIIESCILAIIKKRETYGYEILKNLSDGGFDTLQEGTLYPILTRLEKKGYIICRKEKSPLGPVRKYFSITDKGRIWLEEFRESFKNITNNANGILFDEHAVEREENK